jgi:hypothetical protein
MFPPSFPATIVVSVRPGDTFIWEKFLRNLINFDESIVGNLLDEILYRLRFHLLMLLGKHRTPLEMSFPGRQSVLLLEVGSEPVTGFEFSFEFFTIAIDLQPIFSNEIDKILVCKQVMKFGEITSNGFLNFRLLPVYKSGIAHSVICIERSPVDILLQLTNPVLHRQTSKSESRCNLSKGGLSDF